MKHPIHINDLGKIKIARQAVRVTNYMLVVQSISELNNISHQIPGQIVYVMPPNSVAVNIYVWDGSQWGQVL